MVNDFEKEKVGGVPKGCFLICVNTKEVDLTEVILLRVIEPIKLPAHSEVLASRVEYYKEFIPKNTQEFEKKLDPFTRNEFQYSGLECRVLGTFYREGIGGNEVIKFGADVENFYSSHNYTVYKPTGELLKFIVNYNGESSIIGGKGYSKLGELRYSSSRKNSWSLDVPIYINPKDLLKNRTACFGMTRTGKSNTVKKIIDCTVALSKEEERKIGQIIFDINGEYANPNKQDEGTAIYEKYEKDVERYSIIDKENFSPMRANFFNEPEFALQIIRPFLSDETSDYVKNFNSIDLSEPDKDDPDYRSILCRRARVKAAFFCCLKKADFAVKSTFEIKFSADKDLRDEINGLLGKEIDPSQGISVDEAIRWFEVMWENYDNIEFFKKYLKKKDKEWADDDLKTVLRMLTLKKPGGKLDNISGYKKLRRKDLKGMHTEKATSHFEKDIIKALRDGKIVIVDLSEGEELVRKTYSERIVATIFNDSMLRFIDNEDETDGFNIIQMYFEE
ncbi:MAG: helicase HerA domain-containing protein, partial [Clostridium sp.]